MIGTILDYSAGLPGAKNIKAAGHIGAVRYVGFSDRTKCTNRGEVADFDAHGLGMAAVFQNNTADWRGGFEAGRVNGQRGRGHSNSIGLPVDIPIYMAIDADVVQTGEFATMIEYLRGANASLGGPALTGVYGEADVIDRARDAGVASFYWQTVAWSRGRRTSAHLFQRVGTVFVGGIACDVNEVLTPDWGQHNAEDLMPTLDEIEAMIKNRVLAGDWRFDGNRNPIDMSRQTVATGFENGSKLDLILSRLNAMMGALSDDEANVIKAMASGNAQLLAAIAAIPPGGAPTPEQVDQLAAQLREGLGEEIAHVIGTKLLRPVTS